MMIKTQDGSVVLSINTEYEARYQSTSGPELLFTGCRCLIWLVGCVLRPTDSEVI